MRPITRMTLPRLARPATRSFARSSRLRLKEDQPSSTARAEEIEKAKKDQLHKGEWKEELASAGESHIKADKEQVHDHDAHIDELQKQTAAKSQQEHPDSK